MTDYTNSNEAFYGFGWGPRWKYAAFMGILSLMLSLMMVSEHFN